MTDAEVVAAVWFDYGCPFSYLAQAWFDAAGARLDLRPISLAEAHRVSGSLPVWQMPVDRLDPVVLSLAGHELVREAGGDLDEYRRRMYAFCHEEPPTPRVNNRALARRPRPQVPTGLAVSTRPNPDAAPGVRWSKKTAGLETPPRRWLCVRFSWGGSAS